MSRRCPEPAPEADAGSPTSATPTLPLALRAAAAAEALAISERQLWTLTNQDLIPHVHLGRSVIYPVHLLQQWLANQAGGGTKE